MGHTLPSICSKVEPKCRKCKRDGISTQKEHLHTIKIVLIILNDNLEVGQILQLQLHSMRCVHMETSSSHHLHLMIVYIYLRNAASKSQSDSKDK